MCWITLAQIGVKTMIETGAYTTNMNQAELLNDGVDWLRQKFGDVGTELFIYLVIREKFDYTRWRRQFFGDKSVNEINEEAADYSRNDPFKLQKLQVLIQREGWAAGVITEILEENDRKGLDSHAG